MVEALCRQDAEGPDNDPCRHLWSGGALSSGSRSGRHAGWTDGGCQDARNAGERFHDEQRPDSRGRTADPWHVSFRVKSPEESKYRFDYYELLATIPGEEAFRPMEEGGCPLLRKP